MISITFILYCMLAIAALAVLITLPRLCGIVYIPHDKIGVIEKIWSASGSLQQGRIVAHNREAGYQANILRGGVHFWLFPWQYRIHKTQLVTIAEGRIGYVYARDGLPLDATQTLGRTVESNHFQDSDAFLKTGGQRGRQRAILREGVYALNLALFVVITETGVYSLEQDDAYTEWQRELAERDGFNPIVIGPRVDNNGQNYDLVGIITVQDGPTLPAGDIIAPEVPSQDGIGHNYFQDPEAFLQLGGQRGRQLQVLTDGTFFINRWFATVEVSQKTLIPIGYVGVVVAYYGEKGDDTTGEAFRYGEQVEAGTKGVWKQALAPGKYALNPYAVKIEMVPTVNFVLRWITGQTENHHYDDELATIELITSDGYEPLLPLSLVLHIDYQKAPSVVQRFGDVKRLITQTLDPILTAYFRDVAQSSTMLELLTHREDIQSKATVELRKRFTDFDINCVAVLIGRPESKIKEPENDPIERLFDQLRQRRLADEKRETFAKQREAANHQREFEEAQARAAQQAHLTESKIAVEIAANRGDAQVKEAERMALREIALAEGQAKARKLEGEGEASKIMQIGNAEAGVFEKKIAAYGDARLFILPELAQQLANSKQALVPQQVMMTNGETGQGSVAGPLSTLISLLTAEKAGMPFTKAEPPKPEPAPATEARA